MKKTAFAILLGSLAIATTANANWYVQGDFGRTKIKSGTADDGQFNKNVSDLRLSVGYKFTDFRIALDYTRYGTVKERYEDDTEVTDTTLKLKGFGVSAIYDFNLNSPIKPFVGARLALNTFSDKDDTLHKDPNVPVQREVDSSKETRLGYGALAGASYDFTPNFAAVGTVEYNHLGRSGDVKVNSYGAKIGLRYSF